MHAFEDINGKTWEIAVTVGSIKRVIGLVGVNLAEATDGKLFERLAGDPIELCNVLYALVKPQADAAGITDEQFGEALAGDSLGDATMALLDEIAAFFPPARRAVLTRALGKIRAIESRMSREAIAKMDSPEMDRKLETLVAKFSDSVSNLLESPESIHMG